MVRKRNIELIVALLIGLQYGVSQQALGSEGETTFKQKCASCHTVGKGNLVGPDLVVTGLMSDEALNKSIKRMEAMAGPLSADDVQSIRSYLRQAVPTAKKAAESTNPAGGKSSSTEASGNRQATTTIDEKQGAVTSPEKILASAAIGRQLFMGQQPLKNGGSSCVSCHSVNSNEGSSSLGPNLSNVFDRLPSQALIAATEQTPFKVMKPAYAAHPVTHEEAVHIAGYLSSLKEHPERGKPFSLAYAGGAGAILLILGIAFGYRKRNKGARAKLQRR